MTMTDTTINTEEETVITKNTTEVMITTKVTAEDMVEETEDVTKLHYNSKKYERENGCSLFYYFIHHCFLLSLQKDFQIEVFYRIRLQRNPLSRLAIST